MDQEFSNYLANKKPRIKYFLRAAPFLELSEKAWKSIAKKFGTTVDVIEQVAEELKHKP